MKKLIGFLFIVVLLTSGVTIYLRFFAPTTQFEAPQKIIYIRTNAAVKDVVLKTLQNDSIVKSTTHFEWMATQMGYWENLKPGRYKIDKDMSVRDIIKHLRSGNQAPSRLTINHLRLPQDLARVMNLAIESDSAIAMEILGNETLLAEYDMTHTNWASKIIPDTYEVIWTWKPERVLQKLRDDHERWWKKNDRLQKAAALGLTPEKVHIIASIVEEETNKKDDKPLVASVYLNRLKVGMPLQADPTVRFAMKDFKSNRVLYTHLRTPSPYNTYLNAGLPPGPICTASPASLEAVLNAPKTDYIFFVAKSDLRGGSTFTSNYKDHTRAAKEYQDSLTVWLKKKAIREKAKKDSIELAQKTNKS